MADKSDQADVPRSLDLRRPSATNTASSGDFIVHISSRATTAVNSPTIAEESDSEEEEPQFESATRRLEEYPKGYPLLAAFQSSDASFSIYRSFEYLHSRVLLDLQYELSELEKELQRKDAEHSINEKGTRRLKSRRRDDVDTKTEVRRSESARTRRHILADIRQKLVEYDEVLIKARDTGNLQRPSKRDYNSVTAWFNNRKPLVEKEWYSLQQREDMVTLRQGREWAYFDGLIERMLRKSGCTMINKMFRPSHLPKETSDKDIHYYDSQKVETCVAMIITVVIFILLVLPVVAMYHLTSIGDRSSTFDAIGVLVVFTLLFSAAMSLLTKAKRHELFGASAAYCAVLVVFISNFSGPSDGGQQVR